MNLRGLLRCFVLLLLQLWSNPTFAQSDREDLSAERAELKRLQQLVDSYFDKRDAETGMPFANQAVDLAMKLEDSSAIISSSYMQAKLYRLLNHVDSAVTSLIRAYSYARKPYDLYMLDNQLGETFMDLDCYHLAIPYLENLVEKEPIITSKFFHFNLLGRCYIQAGMEEKAIALFEQQLEVGRKIGGYHYIANARNNLCYVFREFRRYEEARKAGEACLQLLDKQPRMHENDQIIYDNCLINLGVVEAKSGRYARAIGYFEESRKRFKKYHTPSSDVPIIRTLIESYLATGKPQQAKELLQLGQSYAKTILERSMIADGAILYYRNVGDYPALSRIEEEAKRLKNELHQEEMQRKQRNIDLLGKLYIGIANQGIELEKSRRVKAEFNQYQAQKKKEEIYWVLLVVLCVSVSVIGSIVLISRTRHKRILVEKKLAESERQNLDFALKLKEKDILKFAVDLSHRKEIIQELLTRFKGIAAKDPEEVKKLLVEELKELKSFASSRATLDQFLEHTGNINAEFHDKLKKLHPDLTQYEIELCSYYVLNMSNKDVANLRGISPTSARMSKMRLKKKLHLTDQDLVNYLLNL